MRYAKKEQAMRSGQYLVLFLFALTVLPIWNTDCDYLEKFWDVKDDGKDDDEGHVSAEFAFTKVVASKSRNETNSNVSFPGHYDGAVDRRHQSDLYERKEVLGPVWMVVSLVLWPDHWKCPQHCAKNHHLKSKRRILTQFELFATMYVVQNSVSDREYCQVPIFSNIWQKANIFKSNMDDLTPDSTPSNLRQRF